MVISVAEIIPKATKLRQIVKSAAASFSGHSFVLTAGYFGGDAKG